MSCSPAVTYSVCKPDISEISKSEPGYALLAIIPSEHTQQRIWQKVATLAHWRVLFIGQNVHHKQPQHVMDFSLFLVALYLLWDNFLISEMTSMCMNNTTKKTPCHPRSVHFLGMLIAENAILPQLSFERSVNEICALLGFYAASIGSFLPTFRDKLVVVTFSQRCSWRFRSSGTFRPVDWSVYLHLQGQQPKMKALHSTETSITLHQPTGRNLHQNLCENVISQNRRPCRTELLCMMRLLRIIAAFKIAPYWSYFSFRALWYITTLVNTNKCTIRQSMYSFYYM